MIKNFIKRGLIGIGFGNIISFIILFLICKINKTESLEVNMVLRSIIASSIVGFMFAGASILFESDNISMLKATVLHFCILFVTYYAMAILGKWITWDLIEIVINLVIFVATYISIWCGIYFGLKAKVKKMNKKINQM